MGGFWKELFRLVGTQLTPSTSYHPHTDGKTEIVSKWMEWYFRNYVLEKKMTCIKWLQLGENLYKTTYHMLIRMTPFTYLYDYDATTFMDRAFGDNWGPKAKDWIQESHEML